ncbi:MAG: hypothetical protein ACLUZZ_00020 [Alistipes inops]
MVAKDFLTKQKRSVGRLSTCCRCLCGGTRSEERARICGDNRKVAALLPAGCQVKVKAGDIIAKGQDVVVLERR